MKKVLLLSVALFLGFSSFAQIRTKDKGVIVSKVNTHNVLQGEENSTQDAYDFRAGTPMTSTVNRWESMDEYNVMTTSYDFQSYSNVSNRMVQWQDGSVAATAMWSASYNSSASDRGTGYNIALDGDFNNWSAEPMERIESERTGWPSIAQYGQNGEIVVAHGSNGLVYHIRETKGEGEWVRGTIPNPISGILSWPRIVTSGTDNDVVHIIAATQDAITKELFFYYVRTDDGCASWTVEYFPGMDPGTYFGIAVDDYALSAKDDVVACLFSGSLKDHAFIMKSEDNGLTWEKKMIWEHPYYGYDWSGDPMSVFIDTLYAPETGSLTIDKNGVVHVALSVREFIHPELGNGYYSFLGLDVDGIMYWNDTQNVVDSPDGNLHHACRLWWPVPGGYNSHWLNEFMFCGWLPADENGSYVTFDKDKVYPDYGEYFEGLSAHPAIAVDDDGNIAVAYSSPNMSRISGEGFYFRNVYVSYKSCDEDTWTINKCNLMEDFIHSMTEGLNVVAVPYSANVGEFVFAYMEDDFPGFAIGTTPSQLQFTENKMQVVKLHSQVGVSEETINPLTSVYPNPATDVVYVNSSMNTDAVVTFRNVAGQVVKTINKSLTIGANGINVNDLTLGVYFCTINANGYSKTTKVVVE